MRIFKTLNALGWQYVSIVSQTDGSAHWQLYIDNTLVTIQRKRHDGCNGILCRYCATKPCHETMLCAVCPSISLWRQQMELFSVLLVMQGIHPVNSPLKCQWRGALMFYLIYALNEQLSKQSGVWWFETASRSFWRHCNDYLLMWLNKTYTSRYDVI